MGKEEVMAKPETAVRDAVDHVRAATQELHQAISDTMAKRGSATKAEIESFIQKAKAASDLARSAVHTQGEAAKQHLTQTVTKLEATREDATEILEAIKKSGQVFRASLAKALADARASVQSASEAVAARRSQNVTKHAS